MDNKTNKLSILIPVYNDQDVLEELNARLMQVIPAICDDFEIVLVDDGSKDKSWQKIEELKQINSHIVGIKLMRNFGQQNAIAAGLDYVHGDLIVIMDSDLQDRPEDIPKLIDALNQSDASMAIAKWKSRKDGFFKKSVSKLFYSVSRKITKIKHEPHLGVFRVIRKETVDELKKYEEKTSTTLSLLYWIGVDYVAVELERDERFAGKSGYNLKKMILLTMDRIFSFSMFPIRAAIYTGLLISAVSFIIGVILILRHFFGNVAPGWTSIVVLVLFLFGVNFIFMGIIGEYLGRVFLESKKRPKYVIKKILE
ncbi:MAG: glycosyltransferase family 2 protein [Bacteroidetes bacterium]|nr:glycosyltransferase family 2 protein [Bacteroidota bacterium]MBU1719955.1 glycosyltransferase family 2 protein [Bacteroidota bacterium]